MSKKKAPAAAPAPGDPSRLTPAELAALLTKVGSSAITSEMIAADVAAGAPTNADGTLHLVHYAAWLAKVRSQNAE